MELTQRTDGSGVATLRERAYDRGYVDERSYFTLSDVHVTFTLEGDPDQAKAHVEAILLAFLAGAGVSGLAYTVTTR